jgi:hypothetical protein
MQHPFDNSISKQSHQARLLPVADELPNESVRISALTSREESY